MEFYVLPNVLNRRIVNLPYYINLQMFVAGRTEMQMILIFVVLAFSDALIPYALPIVLYVGPLIIVGLLISFLTGSVRHHSKTIVIETRVVR